MTKKLRTSRAITKCGVLMSVIALLAVGLGFLPDTRTVRADNTYFALTPGTPFSQDWSNPGLITINDEWLNVPSIQGFSQDLGNTPGVNPQTILAGFTTIDVIPNTTPANVSGGVGEMDGLANPVVALQGADDAGAPNLDISLNTTGCAGASNQINVAYNVRDIDGSADDAVQQVALQYRLGSFGNFTNVLSATFPMLPPAARRRRSLRSRQICRPRQKTSRSSTCVS